eukprot:2547813-Prymnesium_polylepis.2
MGGWAVREDRVWVLGSACTLVQIRTARWCKLARPGGGGEALPVRRRPVLEHEKVIQPKTTQTTLASLFGRK